MSDIITGPQGSTPPSQSLEGPLGEKIVRYWPAFVVLVAGMSYSMGRAEQKGFMQALGIDSLNPSMPKEDYVYSGVTLLMEFGAAICACAMLAYSLRLFHHLLPRKAREVSNGAVRRCFLNKDQNLRGLITFLIFIAVMMANWGFDKLELKDLPLLNSPETALFGPADLLSLNGNQVIVLVMILGMAMAAGLSLVFRAIMFMRSSFFKISFTGWILFVSIGLLLRWSALNGAAQTIGDYPVVAGAAIEQIVGKGTLCLFLGSDEKTIALFWIRPGDGQDWKRSDKGIVFIPRSDTRWWARLPERKPLYRFAFIKWLKLNAP